MVTEQNLFFAAGVVGLGPALALMFCGLRRYDYPYVDKALFSNRRLFGSFAIGMVVGTLSAAVTYLILFSIAAADLAGLFVLFLAIGLFDESFKLVYLNSRPLRGRFDATFYGVALGLGMAATTAMAWAYQGVRLPDIGFTPVTLLAFAALSVGFNGFGCFTGAVLGLGAAQGYMRIPFAEAASARAVLALLLTLFISAAPSSAELSLGSALTGVALALALTWMAFARLLPEALPQDVRRQRRRRARRGRAAGGP